MVSERRIQPQVAHPPFRQVDFHKLRTKRLSCKICANKVCVGRCKFEKLN